MAFKKIWEYVPMTGKKNAIMYELEEAALQKKLTAVSWNYIIRVNFIHIYLMKYNLKVKTLY